MTGGFLESMARSSHQRLAESMALRTSQAMRAAAETIDVPPLGGHSFHVFAEIKPASPAEGPLLDGDPADKARRYVEGGATALSVLTEPTRFGGSAHLLESIARLGLAPVMRKDFLVDPYQIWEARSLGASGVLIIARLFDTDGTLSMVDAARQAGLFAVLEVFDDSDLPSVERALDHHPEILVGVNSRDLATLEVRPHIHEILAPKLPAGATLIAESGISTASRAAELRAMGYSGVLIGSSLMRSEKPARLIREILAVSGL